MDKKPFHLKILNCHPKLGYLIDLGGWFSTFSNINHFLQCGVFSRDFFLVCVSALIYVTKHLRLDNIEEMDFVWLGKRTSNVSVI